MVENKIVIVIPQFLLGVLCESDFFLLMNVKTPTTVFFSGSVFTLKQVRKPFPSPAIKSILEK